MIETSKSVRKRQKPDGRFWDDYKDNPHLNKGKFTVEEIDLLKNSLLKYATDNSLDEEGLRSLIISDTKKSNKRAWCIIGEVLPNRSLQSCHNLLKRKFHPNNYKGDWSPEEEIRLLELVGKLGSKWKAIAEEMGRTPTNIKDKWKHIGGECSEEKTEEWTMHEILWLFKAIGKGEGAHFISKKKLISNKQKIDEYGSLSNAQKKEALEDILGNIIQHKDKLPKSANFTEIARMLRTKSAENIRKKYSAELYPYAVRACKFTNKDNLHLIDFVSGFTNFHSIDFSFFNNDRSPKENSNQWITLAKSIGRLPTEDLQVTVKILREKLNKPSGVQKEARAYTYEGLISEFKAMC